MASMAELAFSDDQLTFDYVKGEHLKCVLRIKNPTDQYALLKFKLTRPKYYLVKAEHGYIKPKEEIVVEFRLHIDGVDAASEDKIKCFYLLVKKLQQEPMNIEMAEGVTTQKLCVYINNLPEDLKRSALLSEVKSTRSKNSSKNALGASRRSLNIAESTVKEKQARISSLKGEIQTLRKGITRIRHKQSPISWLIIAVAGLAVGILSALWI